MKSHILRAVSLHLLPLDTQIKNAGGEGFNAGVEVEPISGSFSALYTFKTDDGYKTMMTENTFTVGLIDAEINHFVEFRGDGGEYVLITPKETKKGKILMIKSLGFSFKAMKESLISLWPNRVVWNLTDPMRVLKCNN